MNKDLWSRESGDVPKRRPTMVVPSHTLVDYREQAKNTGEKVDSANPYVSMSDVSSVRD